MTDLPPIGKFVARIVRIFRDHPADDSSVIVLQDYARAAIDALSAGKDAERHPLEAYADSYAQMSRDGGKVDCRSVEVDIRQNMIPVTQARTSPSAVGLGVTEAREAFLNLIADAQKWHVETDGDETGVTTTHTIITDDSQLVALVKALGIEIRHQELVEDAIDRALEASPSPGGTE